MPTRGVITKWIQDKGFGFVRPDSVAFERDVFLHISELERAGITEPPQVGQRFDFDAVPDNRGAGRYRAINVAEVV